MLVVTIGACSTEKGADAAQAGATDASIAQDADSQYLDGGQSFDAAPRLDGTARPLDVANARPSRCTAWVQTVGR